MLHTSHHEGASCVASLRFVLLFFFIIICLEHSAVNRKCSGCVFRRMRLPSHHPQNNDGYILCSTSHTARSLSVVWCPRPRSVCRVGGCHPVTEHSSWSPHGAQNQNINEESDKYIQQQQLHFKKGVNSLEKLLLIRHMYHIIRHVRQIHANKVMCCLHLLSFHFT